MHDIEGGLVYLRARYYEPKTMRFLQQDTMFGEIQEPLTRNLYIYGNANPLTYTDPSGHLAIVEVNPNGELIVYNQYTGNVFNSRTGEVLEHIEPSDEGTGNSTNWIPDEMQLDGSSAQEEYLKVRLDKLGIKWDQTKIHVLWEATEEINKEYGVQLDPRFMLAIIIHEGTGSFNTSSENKAADGQNGVEADYAKDLMKAYNLVFGKVLGYIEYGAQFKQAVSNNSDKSGINGSGDIFQYCNWATPIVDLKNGTVRTGVYAGDSAWHNGIRSIYENLTYSGAANDYSNYLSEVDSGVVSNVANGISLPSYNFVASQNGQDWLGRNNNTWTIIGKFKK